MSAITFIVPFAPVAWERTGVRWTNQGPKHYTQAQTRAWQKTVAVYGRSAMRGAAPFTGAVKLEIAFHVPIPESWAKWKREAAERGEVAPTVKPDLDNFEKSVKDALKGIAWVDDAQVVQAVKSKAYSNRPGVAATITPLNLLPAQVSRRPNRGDRS